MPQEDRAAKVSPEQLWSSTITYITTDEGWLNLAAVIDLFSRQVVGGSPQPHMLARLVKDAHPWRGGGRIRRLV